MRQIEVKDLTNKTIRSIDNTCVNSLTLYFTDGTSVELVAELSTVTSCGAIPGIFIEEENND